MRHPLRFSVWLISVLFALGLLAWSNAPRWRHAQFVAALGDQPSGATANARPRLVVPEHINESYQWLLQTRQMFERHELRVRHIDYENAPFGRDVATASPYRWWLGLLAWTEHQLKGVPIEQAIERAALLSDPLLQALLLVATAALVGWQFGSIAGTFVALMMALLFPFSAAFLPATPDDAGLIATMSLWSVLLLAVGLSHASRTFTQRTGPKSETGGGSTDIAPAASQSETGATKSGRRWFMLAGVVGGVALWLSPGHEIPVLGGVALGAVLAAWFRRSATPGTAPAPLPWRAWAVAGAVTTLIAYLLEYFPDHLGGWQFRAMHPLHGLAWLGLGELLAQIAGWIESRRVTWSGGRAILFVGALLALAALPVGMWKLHDVGFLHAELWDLRLTKLPGSPVQPSFGAWLRQNPDSLAVTAVLLPWLMLLPVLGFTLRASTPVPTRTLLAIALGAFMCSAPFALRQIAWFTAVNALLIPLGVGLVLATTGDAARWMWTAGVAILCLPGVFIGAPRRALENPDAPTQPEVFALIERDMAAWLALHAPGGHAVFVAPPSETTALSYYGGGDGIATLSWQNKDGLEAAVRILSASTPEEAKALIDRRHITHIIMPSWDPYLDVYARMGMGQLDGTFINRLHQWKVPTWLRPVPYVLPVIHGFEQQAVTLFEVVDEQSDPIALSRTAEYFLELGRLPEAAGVGQLLRRYPADMNAWIARAEVEAATGDEAALAKSMNVLLPYANAKRDRSLPWDLRVGLAVLLARTKHVDQAKAQVQRCVNEANEARLRALATGSLYRLLVLSRAYNLPLKDAALHELALQLLPADARKRLE